MTNVISIKQLSEYGIPASTAYKLLAKGQGPAHIRRGRRIQFMRRDVEAWLEAQKVKAQ
jgi:excisionase family DNA binding protein